MFFPWILESQYEWLYTHIALRALKVSYSNEGEAGLAVNCEKTRFFLNTLYISKEFWFYPELPTHTPPASLPQPRSLQRFKKFGEANTLLSEHSLPILYPFPFPLFPLRVWFFFISFNQYIQIYLIVPIFNNVHDIFLYGCIFIIFFFIYCLLAFDLCTGCHMIFANME